MILVSVHHFAIGLGAVFPAVGVKIQGGVAIFFEVDLTAALIAVGAHFVQNAKLGKLGAGHFKPAVTWVCV